VVGAHHVEMKSGVDLTCDVCKKLHCEVALTVVARNFAFSPFMSALEKELVKLRLQRHVESHGMAWYGMVWHGMAWYGMVWLPSHYHMNSMDSMWLA
jgi:hypothetical protein